MEDRQIESLFSWRFSFCPKQKFQGIAMLNLIIKRCFCLLLLSMYLALTLQLVFGSRSVFSYAKPDNVGAIAAKLANEYEKSIATGGEQKSVHPSSITVPRLIDQFTKRKNLPQNSGEHKRKDIDHPENTNPSVKENTAGSFEKDNFAEAKHFINETPFKNKVKNRGTETTPTTPKNLEDENIWLQGSTTSIKSLIKKRATEKQEPYRKVLMSRIKQASDSSLYSQMLDKLKSLGSAVTREQLRAVADKCGGDKPKLRHVQTYDFVHSPDNLCSAGELLALVAVHSNAKNLGRRATIRRTWGSLRYIGRFRIEVAFFLGRPASGDSDESGATGAQLEALIDAESSRFGDIVQLNYTENYRNMTIKHLGVYEWLLRRCRRAQFLVKVDDDTFVDVAHLAAFLSKGAPSGLYCSSTQGAKPHRTAKGPGSKWRVSHEEFPEDAYPTYCEGFGYTINIRHAGDIYLCSFFKQYFWIDDVHVTGTLASSLGVTMVRFWSGHEYSTLLPSLASERIVDYIFLTAYDSTFLDSLWVKMWRSVLQYSLDVNL